MFSDYYESEGPHFEKGTTCYVKFTFSKLHILISMTTIVFSPCLLFHSGMRYHAQFSSLLINVRKMVSWPTFQGQ